MENKFVVHVINPIQTDGWRKGTEIRKHKTDIIDSVLIADFIRYDDFLETSLGDEDTLCPCVTYHALGIILLPLFLT
ncbi:IS110 family transposase [Clostridium sp. Marseille-QA1073]